MKQTTFYLTAALSLLLTSLLAGCGSAPPPPLETLSGEWVDFEARVEACGKTDYIEIQMDLNLESDDESVYGDMTLINDYGDFYSGPFLGRVTPSGKLTGVVEVFNDWSYEFILFSADLTFKSSGVSGTLTEVDGVECEDGRPGKFSIKVNLQRGSDEPSEPDEPQAPIEDDTLEPNDSRDEATEVELDYQAELVLRNSDWFTFTLDEERLVTLDVQTDNASYFNIDAYIYIYDEVLTAVNNFDFYKSSSQRPRTFRLAAGTYYLNLSGSIESETQAYKLSLSSEALPDANFEPNNSAETATEISLNFSGSMYVAKEDEDWFAFTLSEARLVTFNLGDSDYGFDCALYDAELKTIRDMTYRKSPFTETLEAGTYYLRTYDGRYNGGLDYPLTISSEPTPDAEYEPNNSFNTAVPVQLPFSADLYMTKTDEDWLSFTLTKEQLVTFKRNDDNPYGLRGNLYTGNGNQFDEGETFGIPINQASSFILPADTYTVSLSGGNYPYSKNFGYSLSIVGEAIPDLEYEPNNSRGEARGISLGFSDSELLVSEGDSDWFSFTLDAATQVDITLENRGNGHPSSWLNDADGNYIQMIDGTPNTPVLPAGTYYLEVFSPWEAKKYGLSIVKSQ